MFNKKATQGIREIEELLTFNGIEFAYVSNVNILHSDEGRDYHVPLGIPVCYLRTGGTGGYMVEISRLDDEFRSVSEYSIRINGTLKQAQKAQIVLNEILLNRDYNKNGIDFTLDGNRYEAGKLYDVYIKTWAIKDIKQLERRAKMLNYHFESDGHKHLTFRNMSSMGVLRLHNRIAKPNESMIWLECVVTD